MHPSMSSALSIKAIKGEIDLSESPLSPSVRLDGQWSCYQYQFIDPSAFLSDEVGDPDRYVTIPGTWHSKSSAENQTNWHGWFTFHLKIRISDTDKIYSIQTRHIGTAYRIFINQKELGGNGMVSTNEATHKPGYKNRIFSFKTDQEIIHVTIHTCNFYDPIWGYTRPIIFGEENAVRMETFADYSLDFAVSIFLAVLIFFLLFRYTRLKDKSQLYLSLTLLAVLLKNLFEDGKVLPYFLTITPMFNHRILYFAYIAISVLLFFYFTQRFKRDIRPVPVIILKVIGILLGIFSLVYPIQFNVSMVSIFHIFTLITIIYYFTILIKNVIRKDPLAPRFLLAFSFLSLCAAIDVSNTFGLVNFRYIIPMGFVLFTVFVTINEHLSQKQEKQDTLEGKEAQLEAFFTSLSLSEREKEIASLLMKGFNNREIGAKIFISANTVKFHLKNIFSKARVQNRMEILHKFLVYLERKD